MDSSDKKGLLEYISKMNPSVYRDDLYKMIESDTVFINRNSIVKSKDGKIGIVSNKYSRVSVLWGITKEPEMTLLSDISLSDESVKYLLMQIKTPEIGDTIYSCNDVHGIIESIQSHYVNQEYDGSSVYLKCYIIKYHDMLIKVYDTDIINIIKKK